MGLIDEWLRDEKRGAAAYRLKQRYELQGRFLYEGYQPLKADPSIRDTPFLQRLSHWLDSFPSSEDSWIAFSTLRYFFYVGQQETDELYRCAVQHKLTPWLVDKGKLRLFDRNFDQNLCKLVEATFPCPVTDSLRINDLLHITRLEGQKIRPDWLSQKVLDNGANLKGFIAKHGIRFVALFEDFAGSGKQCEGVLEFALKTFDGPIIFIPLVVCAPADEKFKALALRSDGRLTYCPVVVLSADCLIGSVPTAGEPASFEAFRTTLTSVQKSAKFNIPAFGRDGVGSLYCSYSNCPNNSPPIYHSTRKKWPHPLFPRENRV